MVTIYSCWQALNNHLVKNRINLLKMGIIKCVITVISLTFIYSCTNGVEFKGGKTYDINAGITKDSLKIKSEIDSILIKSDSTLKFKIGPTVKDTIIFD